MKLFAEGVYATPPEPNDPSCAPEAVNRTAIVSAPLLPEVAAPRRDDLPVGLDRDRVERRVGGAHRVLMGERAGAGEACVKRPRRRQPRDQRVWHLQPGRLRTGDHDRAVGLQRDRQRIRERAQVEHVDPAAAEARVEAAVRVQPHHRHARHVPLLPAAAGRARREDLAVRLNRDRVPLTGRAPAELLHDPVEPNPVSRLPFEL